MRCRLARRRRPKSVLSGALLQFHRRSHPSHGYVALESRVDRSAHKGELDFAIWIALLVQDGDWHAVDEVPVS